MMEASEELGGVKFELTELITKLQDSDKQIESLRTTLLMYQRPLKICLRCDDVMSKTDTLLT